MVGLLDPRRVDVAVLEQPLQGQSSNSRLTPSKPDRSTAPGVSSTMKSILGEGLERADVPPSRPMIRPFSSSDLLDHGHRGLDRVAARHPLHDRGEDAPGTPVGVASGLLLDLTDQPRAVVADLVLELRSRICLACPTLRPESRSSSRTCSRLASLSRPASFSRLRRRSSSERSRSSSSGPEARATAPAHGRASSRASSARRARSSSSTVSGLSAGAAAASRRSGGGGSGVLPSGGRWPAPRAAAGLPAPRPPRRLPPQAPPIRSPSRLLIRRARAGRSTSAERCGWRRETQDVASERARPRGALGASSCPPSRSLRSWLSELGSQRRKCRFAGLSHGGLDRPLPMSVSPPRMDAAG